MPTHPDRDQPEQVRTTFGPDGKRRTPSRAICMVNEGVEWLVRVRSRDIAAVPQSLEVKLGKCCYLPRPRSGASFTPEGRMVVRQKLTGHYVGPPDAVKALVAQSVKAAITSPPRAKAARRSGAFVAEHQRC